MLTDGDRRFLEQTTGRKGALAQAILACSVLACLAFAAFHLYLAAWRAQFAGTNLGSVLHDFTKGLSDGGLYSGTYLRALEHVSDAALILGVGIVAAAHTAVYRVQRLRYQRIAGTLWDL